MSLSMALNNLCANYGKFGYGRDLFKQLLLDGISHGLSVKSAYNSYPTDYKTGRSSISKTDQY